MHFDLSVRMVTIEVGLKLYATVTVVKQLINEIVTG